MVQQQEKRIVEYEQRIASDRQHLRELQSKVEELSTSSADIGKDRDRFKAELLNASKVIEDNKQVRTTHAALLLAHLVVLFE